MNKKISGIIFFGDSILAGTGATERERGCAKLVKGQLEVPVLLRGRNWNTSQDGLERLDSDVLQQSEFSHVLILFGNNDCWLQGPSAPKIPMDHFRSNLLEIGQKILRNRQVPIFSNLQPIDFGLFSKRFPELIGYVKKMDFNASQLQFQYSQAIENAASDLDAPCVNIRSKLVGVLSRVIADDGIHPNDSGHEIIANTLIAFFKSIDSSLKPVDSKSTNHSGVISS